ncbi:PolC-type DNA polymerase III [Johnsonella ignava]|uniref:PolC-type DNA polymerase III n=1 Tax=Johnsonella ignava TaxID=43995 RepID=UPI0023EFB6C1|nr:PolC-type DNA polymerase III [Johnsonella ignava]
MKKIFEAFPNLSVSDEIFAIFKSVEVEKIVSSADFAYIKIYICSEHLIHKRYIYDMERLIKDKIFAYKNVRIVIIEKYRLSAAYTPENLYEAYKDSILSEIRNYKIVEYSILKNADIQFYGDLNKNPVMEISIEKNPLNLSAANDLITVLEKIFNDRCGIKCTVVPRYTEYKKPVYDEVYAAAGKFAGDDKAYMQAGGFAGDTGGYAQAGSFGENTGKYAQSGGSKGEIKSFIETNPEYITVDNPEYSFIEQTGSVNSVKKDESDACSQLRKQQYIKSSVKTTKGGESDDYMYTQKKANRNKPGTFKKTSSPDVLYGRDFEDKFIQLADLMGAAGDVIIKGKIISAEERTIKKTGSILYIFSISDFTDSISVKVFTDEESIVQIRKAAAPGTFIKLYGAATIDKYDGELVIGSVKGIKSCEPFGAAGSKRIDLAQRKRVELHCHTKMSEFDGIASAKEIIQHVYDWGMEAVAITDHCNVQAFTEAYHSIDKKKMEKPPKIIYGMEGCLADDLKGLVENPGEYTLDDNFVVFDIETTGFSPHNDRIIEIGAVRIEKGVITSRFSSFVNPGRPIPYRIEELTGINDSMVLDAPDIDSVLPKFLEFCADSAAVAHNASFDTSFIRENAKRQGLVYEPAIIDTVAFARLLLPQLGRFKLDTVCKALDISLENHHRAVDDAQATAYVWLKFMDMMRKRDINRLKDISELSKTNADMVKKMNLSHVSLLAKNDIGRINLYRLVSLSSIEYFNKKPRIPKSLLVKYREGLLIGSACSSGELFNAIMRGASDDELARIVEFYDYLEIQPAVNYAYLLEEERNTLKSIQDIININKKIVALGQAYKKTVVATGDVHFINPEDEVYRRIIMFGKDIKGADKQPPLYFRTTDEMLSEFEYLGSEKAYEVVVKNTNLIADMVEYINPVRPDKCPPVIENSDEMLRNACYEKAYEQYGKNLPDIVRSRLEKELNSIISNGFAVMYIIAKKLVEKSNEEGYLVGSRGSVGSSFAAYTSGITEVNPLPAHYYCECKYVDFDSPEVKAYVGMAGCDMPDRYCPKCGKMLKKDGFDIPFETFLGFKGDKEPDIDLNFSGEYQPHAHEYTEELFGKGFTFRAGTVGTLAGKTAFGYVKNYFAEHGERKNKAEIGRLSLGCVGVKRTTGQHPGGIIVLPHGEEIDTFTPVQKPANDMNSRTITTHFDYHAIDHNLLKLDILGHQDPTMIRMLQDLTGIDPVKDIPLDSKETMSLFKDTSALNIKPEDIMNCKLGALGVPEFGTDFAMQMLIDAKPEGLSDLVRIAGLAHGTDVWLGNAQELIKSGTATIRTAICTRDDIMIYLIDNGIEEGISFKIMEAVRKGKGLTSEQEEIMRDAGIPEWYIGSCKKIKYMFPKAHAAAYVMMAWRIAYCKIFYPIEYYTSYFTIRATGFSYEIMCFGKERLEHYINDYKRREGESALTAKDADTLRDMRIVQEMYARKIEFEPIDIYKAQAQKFIITEERKIMPALSSIDGLGEIAANQIANAAAGGKFISKDDLMERAKIGKSTAELLENLGLLQGLPQSSQISIFDLY